MPDKKTAIAAAKEFVKKVKGKKEFKMTVAPAGKDPFPAITIGPSAYPNLPGGIPCDATYFEDIGVIRLTPKNGAIKAPLLKELKLLLKAAGHAKLKFSTLDGVDNDDDDDVPTPSAGGPSPLQYMSLSGNEDPAESNYSDLPGAPERIPDKLRNADIENLKTAIKVYTKIKDKLPQTATFGKTSKAVVGFLNGVAKQQKELKQDYYDVESHRDQHKKLRQILTHMVNEVKALDAT